MSGNAKQRITLNNLNEPQQMRELNRQLTWIWDQLLGGLSMKSLNSGTREIIDSKASCEEVDELGNVVSSHSTQISQTAEKIESTAEAVETLEGRVQKNESSISQTPEKIQLAVQSLQIGGRNMLRFSKELPKGSTADDWYLFDTEKAYIYKPSTSDYARITLQDSGQTEDSWSGAQSPLVRLPDGWYGKQVTLSAYIWSADWTGMDAGGQGPIVWSVCLSKGGTTRLNYGAKYNLVKPGAAELGADAVSDKTLGNNKWLRISTTFTLDEKNMSSGTGVFGTNTHIFVQFFLRRNGEYRIYAPQLEFGNKATDWSPAPEDTDSEIAELSAELSLQAGEITSHAAKIEEVGQAANANGSDLAAVKKRMTTAEENISALNGEILTKVEQSEFDALGGLVSQQGTEIRQTADNVTILANRQIGGTQLLKDTKRLTLGADADTWRATPATKATTYSHESGFYRMQFSDSGQTADTWVGIHSPLVRLPGSWTGKQVVFSAYIWSADWAGMDAGGQGPLTWGLCLSQGGTTRLFHASKYNVIKAGAAELGADAAGEQALANNKWVRVSVTWVLNEDRFTDATGGESTFSANTHMFVSLYLRRNGNYRVYAPKLEFGNVPTDWCEHPEELIAGSALVLNENEVSISTKKFNVDIADESGTTTMLLVNEDGATFQSAQAPDIAPRYDGPAALYVDPAATSAQIAAGNYFRSLKDALATLDRKWVGKSIVINLAAGMAEYGTLSLTGVSGGGRVQILGSSSAPAKLTGRLNLLFCSSPINIQYLNIDTTSIGINAEGCQTVSIANAVINGPGTGESSSRGIRSALGSSVTVTNCEIYECGRSLYGDGAPIVARNCRGNCRVGAYMAALYLGGTMPCNSTTWAAATWAGQVVTSDISVDQGSASAPVAELTTAAYNYTASDNYAGGWNGFADKDIRQGYNGDRIYGVIWFDAAAIGSALSGRTVKQASLRLHMHAGVGRCTNVSVRLWGSDVSYDRTDSPKLITDYGIIGSTVPGEVNEITIPVQVITDLAGGTIQALVLFSDDDAYYKERGYSKNYARFSGSTSAASSNCPRLTVVYQ